MTLMEPLVVVSLLAILASITVVSGGTERDQLQLAAAARRLQIGLDRGRSIARREQRPCGIVLSQEGWVASEQVMLPGNLLRCSSLGLTLQESVETGPIQLNTNMPAVLRITANGLILDGGIAVLKHQRLRIARCLVVSIPLGVSRIGFYQDDQRLERRLSSSRCLPAHDQS